MARLKLFGPLYVGKLKYWHKKMLPIVEVGTTQESEMPYRKGKCLVFRVPFTYPGYYLGAWVHDPKLNPDDDESIDQILKKALKGRKAWSPDDGYFEEIFKDET
jgi:hypothetical protein